MRNATEFEQEVFAFLDAIRTSGLMNMMGAAPSIKDEFNVSRNESRQLLKTWLRNFNEEGNYKQITAS